MFGPDLQASQWQLSLQEMGLQRNSDLARSAPAHPHLRLSHLTQRDMSSTLVWLVGLMQVACVTAGGYLPVSKLETHWQPLRGWLQSLQ